MSRDHPNYSIVEIGQNTKSPGDLWRLVVTHTPVSLVWKTLKWEKHDQLVNTAQHVTLMGWFLTGWCNVNKKKTKQFFICLQSFIITFLKENVAYWPLTKLSIKICTCVNKQNREAGASGRGCRNITLICGCGWIRCRCVCPQEAGGHQTII